MDTVVGVGEMGVTHGEEAVVVTHALGSCVGVVAFDPVAGVGGILHFQLPDSKLDAEKARRQPCMFGDTGITEFLHRVEAMGASPRRLRVHLFGGAQALGPAIGGNLGKRNFLTARKVLWTRGILIAGEDVGGQVSRTVRLNLRDGTIQVRTVQIEGV